MFKKTLVAGSLLILAPVAFIQSANASDRGNCNAIVQEIAQQGGSQTAQNYLGRKIAWRESGCSMQCVSDRDDLACSRFGLNFKGSMGRFWGRLCGASNREATKNLSVDVRCALRAYQKMGTRPWR